MKRAKTSGSLAAIVRAKVAAAADDHAAALIHGASADLVLFDGGKRGAVLVASTPQAAKALIAFHEKIRGKTV